MLSLLYAVEGAGLNSAGVSCDCLAHRFGNAADHPGRRPVYDTDMTDEQWQVIRPLLPVPAWMENRGARPESYFYRVMLDAVFYVVDTASNGGLCRWTSPAGTGSMPSSGAGARPG